MAVLVPELPSASTFTLVLAVVAPLQGVPDA